MPSRAPVRVRRGSKVSGGEAVLAGLLARPWSCAADAEAPTRVRPDGRRRLCWARVATGALRSRRRHAVAGPRPRRCDPVPRIGPDDRVTDGGFGQRDRAIGQLGPHGHHLLADPRQPEVGDLERAVLGHQQVARLDVAVAVQPLAQGVLQPHAELVAEPQDPRQVQPGRADPSVQVAALHQLEHHVRPAVDDLDRVGPDDVRVLAELDPDPAFRGEPADPDAASQQFVSQGLERDDLTPGLARGGR